eukprot:scaffold531688_cov29-Prasinocladus_malaysianus.AAC.1
MVSLQTTNYKQTNYIGGSAVATVFRTLCEYIPEHWGSSYWYVLSDDAINSLDDQTILPLRRLPLKACLQSSI